MRHRQNIIQQNEPSVLSMLARHCRRELFQFALVIMLVRTLGFIVCHGSSTLFSEQTVFQQTTVTTTTTTSSSPTEAALKSNQQTDEGQHNHHHRQVQQVIADDVRRIPECRGKEPLLEILHTSVQRIHVTREICERLPHPADIEALYGSEPVVYGMETCADYRAMIQQTKLQHNATSSTSINTGIAPMVRVAGLYHTGTNALIQSLHRNLQQNLSVWNASIQTHYQDHLWELYNVPWSKHMPAQFRWNVTASSDAGINKTLVLPVVLIRDPYWWMMSVCREPYDLTWDDASHTRRPSWLPCPRLVRNESSTFTVSVYWESQFLQHFQSLIDVWNQWNRQYLNADFPRLLVRFEDQLFHAKQVMQRISNCSGLPIAKTPFAHSLPRSKTHGKDASSLLTALYKYGRVQGRTNGLSRQDLEYAKKNLDPELMRIFHYKHDKIKIPHAYRRKVNGG